MPVKYYLAVTTFIIVTLTFLALGGRCQGINLVLDSVGFVENYAENSKMKLVRNGRMKFKTSSQRPYGLPRTHKNANQAIYDRHLHCRWLRRSCKMLHFG